MTQERPAAKAVRLLGIKTIADACGLTISAVRKWNANGGHIPAMHQPQVLALALEHNKPLSAADVIGVIQ